MPRSYRHVKDYEKEILELKSQGLSKNEIGKQLGLHLNRYIILSVDIIEIRENLQQE